MNDIVSQLTRFAKALKAARARSPELAEYDAIGLLKDVAQAVQLGLEKIIAELESAP